MKPSRSPHSDGVFSPSADPIITMMSQTVRVTLILVISAMGKTHIPWCVLRYFCEKHKDVKHEGKRKYCSICISLGYGYVK